MDGAGLPFTDVKREEQNRYDAQNNDGAQPRRLSAIVQAGGKPLRARHERCSPLGVALDEPAIEGIGFEDARAAVDHVIERRRAHVDRDTRLIAEKHIEAAQERAATREQDAIVPQRRARL